MPKPMPIDKDLLYKLYHTDNLKMHEVGKRFGVHKDTIRKRMRLYGIPPKAPIVYRKGQDNRIIALLPQAKDLYYTKKFSFGEVCQQLGTGFYTLKRLFDDNHLPLRNSSEAIKLAHKKHPKMKFQTGDKHPRFNGYKTFETKTGYVRVRNPSHPRSGVNGYVWEHILAWEQAHGISLPEGWTVHHLNGIKSDNRPENLAGMPSHAHRLVLAEKAKRIRLLEKGVKELEKTLLEHSKMNLP